MRDKDDSMQNTMTLVLFLACDPVVEREWNAMAPLGLGYLKAIINSRLPAVQVVLARTWDHIVAAQPDLVGISYNTHNLNYAAQISDRVKQKMNCPVIVGGPHITLLPEQLYASMDVGVIGEGEETIVELCQLWQQHNQFSPERLQSIRGIVYRNNQELVFTEPRMVYPELDELPFPDYQSLYHVWGLPEKGWYHLVSSRGCPYRCAFCGVKDQWNQKMRMNSVEYVMTELDHLVKLFSPERIYFCDDIFNIKQARIQKICQAIIDRGYHQKMEFMASVRPNLMTYELMQQLRQANFRILLMGLESGSQTILNRLNKSGCIVEQYHQIMLWARELDIKITSLFIMGTPGETLTDILDTFEFVFQYLDVFEEVGFVSLQIMPGSDICQWACQNGFWDMSRFLPEPDFEPANQFDLLKNTWIYMNENNLPYQEYERLKTLGNSVIEMYKNQISSDLHSLPPDLQVIANHVPISRIMLAKLKKRIAGVFPRRKP